MRKALLFVLLLTVQAYAGDDTGKAKSEGKRIAASAESFIKNNMQSFTGSVSGQAKLKTLEGKEYSVSVKDAFGSVDSINLQVRGGDLYVNIPGRISVVASGICENGFIHCDDEKNWDKCTYYYYDGAGFKTGSFDDLRSCFCISQKACGITWNENWLRWALDKITYMLNLTDKNYVDMVAYPNAIRKFQAVETVQINESQLKDTDALTEQINQNEAVKSYRNNPWLESNSQVKECEIRNYINSYGNTLHTKLVFTNGKDTKGIVCIGIEQTGENRFKCYLTNNLSPSCGVGWSYRVCGSFGAQWNIPDDVGVNIVIGGQTVVNKSEHTDGDDSQSAAVDCDLDAGVCRVNCSGSACFGDQRFSHYGCAHVSISVWNNGGCNGRPTGSFWTYVKEVPDIKINHRDSCGSMGDNCKLKEEWVCFYPPTGEYEGISSQYCIQTVSNFTRRASPKPVCWEMKSSQLGQNWRLCMNGDSIVAISPSGEQITLGKYGVPKGWTYVKRVYYCQPDSRMSVDDAVNRGLYIKEHAYYRQGKVGYSGDVGCAEETIGQKKVYVCLANNQSYSSLSECQANCHFDRAVTVPDNPYLTCKVGDSEGVYLCKVAVPGHQVRVVKGNAEKTNQQGETWNVDVKESEPNTKVDKGSDITYEFRTCELEVDSSGKVVPKCPVNQGERVVKDCYCDITDEAWKALATLEMLDEMSHDIICSKE